MSQPRKPVYMAIVITALSRRVSFDLSFSNAEAIIEISSSDRIAKFFRNSGKLSFVPYTKDFGRITRF